MVFTTVNWNIGGARFLEQKEYKRGEIYQQINSELRYLIEEYNPDVVTLQEIVRYGKLSQDAEDIIDPIEGYHCYSFPLIDSDRLSSKAKWNRIKRLGGWPENTFFAQGNAMLLRNNVPHFPICDLSASGTYKRETERHFIERVNIESGLYFGDRSSEPRAVLIAHFIYNPAGRNGKPLDIFVVNLHLTTLTMEREGIPEIDLEASRVRRAQLDIVFRGIISRYNKWKRQGYPERGERRAPEDWETFERYEPVWILAGDFNFTPKSEEYEIMEKMNFMCVAPKTGSNTKAKGAGNQPILTLDYIFAGPKFISLDPLIIEARMANNNVDYRVKGSDHYPIYAEIPLMIPAE